MFFWCAADHAHKKAPFPGERRKGAHWCENQGYYFFILAAPLVFMGSPL